MKRIACLLALISSAAFAAETSAPVAPVHPLVLAIQTQPGLRDSLSALSAKDPGVAVGWLAGLSAMGRRADAALSPRPAGAAAIALAVRPELVEQLRPTVGHETANWLHNLGGTLSELARIYPADFGAALINARGLRFRPEESAAETGQKLSEIFDNAGSSGLFSRAAAVSRSAQGRARRWRLTGLGLRPEARAQAISLVMNDPRLRVLSQEGPSITVRAAPRDLAPYSYLFNVDAPVRMGPYRAVTLESSRGPLSQSLLEELARSFGVSVDVAGQVIDERSGIASVKAAVDPRRLEDLRGALRRDYKGLILWEQKPGAGMRSAFAAAMPALSAGAVHLAAIPGPAKIFAAIGGFLGFLLGSVPFHKGEDYGWSFDGIGALAGGFSGAAIAGGLGLMASGATALGTIAAGIGAVVLLVRFAATRGPRAPKAAVGRLEAGINRFSGEDFKAKLKAAKKAYRNASFEDGGRYMSRGRDYNYGEGGPTAADVETLRAGLEYVRSDVFDTLVLLVRDLPGAAGEPGVIVVRGADELRKAVAGFEGLTLPGVDETVSYKSIRAAVGYAWR